MSSLKHWVVETDAHQILWLGFDRAGERVNSFSDEVLDELSAVLQEVSRMKDLKGLVIHSLKPKGFIAGADIHTLSSLSSPEHAMAFIQKGQTVFSKLAHLTCPTIAMIHGFCMGGGMELALACDYRIASDEDDTCFALPEILLGFHPGWGGTVRLSQLIGGFHALSTLMLTGQSMRPHRAKALGIVDDVVPFRQLKRAVSYYLEKKPKKHQPSVWQAMTQWPISRRVIGALLRYQVRRRVVSKHYPAPEALIKLWEHQTQGEARAYVQEAHSVEHLLQVNHTAQQLIRAFLLRERLKGFAKETTVPFQHVHVIGAGTMGGDIAAWCARRGFRVTLQDQSYDKIAPAIARAQTLFKKILKKPRLIQAAMDRLVPDPQGHGARIADVIIEAVFEDLSVKQSIFKHLETVSKPDAILATNTSSIPLDDINTVMQHPQRLVGIHFFNPVSKMELVEIVQGEQTSADVLVQAASFVGQLGKLPLPVRSSPGFLVNRVLMPYLLESVQLLEEGYQAEAIDAAAIEFGMLMGPVTLADTVGLDVCLAVANNLTQHFGGEVPRHLSDRVALGHLGKKTGRGFYTYRQGKPIKQKVNQNGNLQDIANRLIMRMVKESMACLAEGVVADADLLDAGMIFGTGFAPFRGGPMAYVRQVEKQSLDTLLTRLEATHGERFKMDLSLL